MKKYSTALFVSAALVSGALVSCGTPAAKAGKWTASLESDQYGIDIEYDGQVLLDGLYASYKLEDGRLVTSKDYAHRSAEVAAFSDGFGEASVLKVTYTDDALPTLVQSVCLYPSGEYLLTEFSLEGEGDLASNYMAPVNVESAGALLESGEIRALFVPYDNDCWVRYASHPLPLENLRSYEVTSVFNNDTRRGLVVGSIEHDNWKTAVDIGRSTKEGVCSIVCFGGAADSLTRDVKAHGFLRGTKIKSPKVLIGCFTDWRNGLEEYARANAVVAPVKAWNGDVPFGWNSWGVLKFGLRGENALQTSDFFAENLQNNHFAGAGGSVVIGLDSGWDRFTEEELKAFVQKCRSNGQVPGIYWTPFTDWRKQGDRPVKEAPEYTWEEIWTRADGKPQELDGAYAIDPTHPAAEQRMRVVSELFRRLGFEYVKMDFMTHGAFEADGWYDKKIQTGTQAYHYGMKLLNEYFGFMYINLSISPVFPSQYAQSRRIACDAWNKIEDTEYTMNALSYGWWIDRVYAYNDADHVVLQQASEGENRARVTSAVITGMFIAGDDFSAAGSVEGKERAKKYLTNAAVNAVATGESFRPVEGNGARSENRFVRSGADGSLHYAVFNYSDEPLAEALPLERLGLDASASYAVRELWSGENVDPEAVFTVPAKDVALFAVVAK